MERGKYIVIEGHDGTGKSTQVTRIRERLAQKGIESLEFHEPAGTPIADEIRNVLKNGHLERDAMTDLLLFSASRHEIWHNHALPALEIGKWVVSARNYWSTIAYQGYGSGLDITTIEKVTKIATDEKYMHPDVGVILHLGEDSERSRRIVQRGELENPDTYESRDEQFQQRVKDGYLKIAQDKNLPIVSATQSVYEVASDLWNIIAR